MAEHQLRAAGKRLPPWQAVPGTPFVVDKFGPGTAVVQCRHWFLTHFHADHYGGLCRRWCQRNAGTIYCTTPTAKLVAERLRVRSCASCAMLLRVVCFRSTTAHQT